MQQGYGYYLHNLFSLLGSRSFRGWGRKRTGRFAAFCGRLLGGKLTLEEDGFIRSVGLGVEGSPSFSFVEDNVGIYYDATTPSKLENLLNSYDFTANKELMATARQAISLIKKLKISKYNNAALTLPEYLKTDTKKVLIIAQTAGDASLKYGLASDDTQTMVRDAVVQNTDAEVYLKVHPDVLARKKGSNVDVVFAEKHCKVITENVNPVVLLEAFDAVYTQTSQMGFEALLLGKEVHLYGMPFYAGWNLKKLAISNEKSEIKEVLKRRCRSLTVEEVFAGAYILYTRYYNPYTQKDSSIADTIKTIVKYRALHEKNEGILYFFGFSRWKRKNTMPFFPALKHNRIYFCTTLEDAKAKGLNEEGKIFIWGKKPFSEVEAYANEHKIRIQRVEDGFVRSVSLGSDLTKAYSLVVDSRGIYFDPTQESDLEHILNTYDFDEAILQRAQKLQTYLIEKKISKYNIDQDKKLVFNRLKNGQAVIVVPGQVEDDASIVYGAKGMKNLQLLKQVRDHAPDAYIVYKPHPDVLAGNRKGNIEEDDVHQFADTVITDASLDSVLELADEVHTMTSLVGFEALIRGKKVTTYGLPFYAGWGLTTDRKKCKRRIRKRTLDELIAAAFILYPRYIDPMTDELCEVEVMLSNIELMKKRYNSNAFYRFAIDSRNMLSRKVQLLIKVLLGE